MDPSYYTGSDTREFGSGEPEREVGCPYCHAREGELHQSHGPTCPMYLPMCRRCGEPTKHEGEPCAWCQAAIRKGAA